MVTALDIRDAVRELGLSNHPLCVHSSLRSFGWVEGGAQTVVNGLLSAGCTVMVPTFSYTFAIPPPPDMRPPRNGWDYDGFEGPTGGIGRVYHPETLEFDRRDMGAVAAAVLATPDHVRGNHPLDSFTAVGPLADELIAGQTPLKVCAPLRAVAAAGGAVVLMGVGLAKMTLLHLAEQMAGRSIFRRWANGPHGQPTEVLAGGCSDEFVNFESLLSPLAGTRTVGESQWHAYPASGVLELASREIRENPVITHCGDPGCLRCDDAVAGGPILAKA